MKTSKHWFALAGALTIAVVGGLYHLQQSDELSLAEPGARVPSSVAEDPRPVGATQAHSPAVAEIQRLDASDLVALSENEPARDQPKAVEQVPAPESSPVSISAPESVRAAPAPNPTYAYKPRGHTPLEKLARSPLQVLADSSLSGPAGPEGLAAEPMPSIVARVSSEKAEPVSLTVGPRSFYSRIDTRDRRTNNTASLVSDLNYALDARLLQKLGGDWSMSFDFSFARYRVTPSTQKTINEGSSDLFGFGLGLQRAVFSRGEIGLKASLGQEVFVGRSTNAANVNIDKLYIPQISVVLSYVLPVLDKLTLGAKLALSALLPSHSEDYSVSLGHAYDAELRLVRKTGFGSLGAATYFGSSFQNTSLTDHSRTDVGVKVSVELDVF